MCGSSALPLNSPKRQVALSPPSKALEMFRRCSYIGQQAPTVSTSQLLPLRFHISVTTSRDTIMACGKGEHLPSFNERVMASKSKKRWSWWRGMGAEEYGVEQKWGKDPLKGETCELLESTSSSTSFNETLQGRLNQR